MRKCLKYSLPILLLSLVSVVLFSNFEVKAEENIDIDKINYSKYTDSDKFEFTYINDDGLNISNESNINKYSYSISNLYVGGEEKLYALNTEIVYTGYGHDKYNAYSVLLFQSSVEPTITVDYVIGYYDATPIYNLVHAFDYSSTLYR